MTKAHPALVGDTKPGARVGGGGCAADGSAVSSADTTLREASLASGVLPPCPHELSPKVYSTPSSAHSEQHARAVAHSEPTAGACSTTRVKPAKTAVWFAPHDTARTADDDSATAVGSKTQPAGASPAVVLTSAPRTATPSPLWMLPRRPRPRVAVTGVADSSGDGESET
jgi:hypothetical protein